MNLRNLLSVGDYIMFMPVGIHFTVQYNASGNMDRLYVGFDSNRDDITKDVLPILLDHRIIPTTIQIKNGTSWVKGVLYTSELFLVDGELPKSMEDSLLERFFENPSQFNFFAAAAESTATEFSSCNALRQFLSLNKFKMLPGWVVPYRFTEDTFTTWLESEQYTFTPIITDAVIFRGKTVAITPLHTTLRTVKKVEKYTDINGYVKLKVSFLEDIPAMCIDYSEAVKFNVQPSCCLIFDSNGEISYCIPSYKKSLVRENFITCACCGKIYQVPESGLVCCPDIHCSSKLLSRITHFCSVLNLPIYDVSIIDHWLKDRLVICIPDLLLLEEYRNCINKVTISKLLRSLISTAVIKTDEVLVSFALACSNKERTFRYYISNPNKIVMDLGISSPDVTALVNWLSDGYNASDLTTLLDSPQIEIVEAVKKFDGAPIFRGKSIFLTGDFIHGGIDEISQILQSYSASVTTQFSNTVDCVLTGGKQDGIDGKAIVSARALHIPVFDEQTFFNQYDIDSDLRLCSTV